MNLRKLARGAACQIRLPGCEGASPTVVLAHYRLAGLCGVGMKPPDVCGCPACLSCHDIADGRRRPPEGYTRGAVRLAHAEGCIRWAAQVDRMVVAA